MKRLTQLALFLLVALYGANAQVSVGDILSHVTSDSGQPIQLCGAIALDPSHPQAALAHQMRARLSSNLDNVPLIVYASLDINAKTLIGPERASGGVICIPQGMVVFFQEAPDELAAVIAHEMGHAIDEACRFQPKTIVQRQSCETRADEVAFTILVNANPPFNPTAMAGAFGRIEGLRGGTDSGFLARITNWNGTHPITPDRVEHVHQMLLKWAGTQ